MSQTTTEPILFKSVGEGTNIPTGTVIGFTIESELNIDLETLVTINSAGEITSLFGNKTDLTNQVNNLNLNQITPSPTALAGASPGTTDCSFFSTPTCYLTPDHPCCSGQTASPTAVASQTPVPTTTPAPTPGWCQYYNQSWCQYTPTFECCQ